MNNMTALVSCFARAYHRWANVVPVFDDTAAEALLGEDFRQIAQNMQQGAAFFLPGFTGTPEETIVISAAAVPLKIPVAAFQHKLIRLNDPFRFIPMAVDVGEGKHPSLLQSAFYGLQMLPYIPVSHPGVHVNADLIRLYLNISRTTGRNKAPHLCQCVYKIRSPHHIRKVGQSHQQCQKLVRREHFFIDLIFRQDLKTAACSGFCANRNAGQIDSIHITINRSERYLKHIRQFLRTNPFFFKKDHNDTDKSVCFHPKAAFPILSRSPPIVDTMLSAIIR